MAAPSGNKQQRNKMSIAEELMVMIHDEEYPNVIQGFNGVEYLNKNELTSLRKMVSGKIWLDGRKFASRQNTTIVNGMFNLFGITLGKNVEQVRAEVCDYLLNPDNKDLRSVIRESLKTNSKSYSDWITKLNSDEYPCDEYGIFLLSHAYKRHVVVILLTKLWCTFKKGSMETFEMLFKADHVLAWLGDDKYSEVKLLHTKAGNENIAEWQLLAESINHLHEKRNSNVSHNRPAKANASTTLKKRNYLRMYDEPISPPTTRRGTKRDTKIDIDYKQFHSEGLVGSKKNRTDKPLPKANGPSTARLASQEAIRKDRISKKSPVIHKTSRKVVTSMIQRQPITKLEYGEPITRSKKLIKPEPDIFMVHQTNKKNVTWHDVHPDGTCCSKGHPKPCSRANQLGEDELPDLVPASHSRNVATSANALGPLISPPPIERKGVADVVWIPDIVPNEPVTPERNLGDLLCTLNFDQIEAKSTTLVKPAVKTHDATNLNRNPDTPLECTENTENSDTNVTPLRIDKTCQQQTPHDNTVNTIEKAVTPHRVPQSSTTELVSPHRGNDVEDVRNAIDSHNEATPHSVLTSPEARELEAATQLIELGNQATTDESLTLEQIDADLDNSVLMPIGSSSQNKSAEDNVSDHNSGDSDKTVDYNVVIQSKPIEENQTNKQNEHGGAGLAIPSPKGNVQYKHYGIRRHSPTTTTTINHRCYYCEDREIFHSKRELNEHHRRTHTTVQCPDCPRVFPTPDALQRHRYVHDTRHQFMCRLCDKITGFKSDLDMHMSVHCEEKKWHCPYDDCDREFKRKSDLTAHEVTHTGEDFICEFAGCKYKNKDPRLVKRHQRVHTKKKTVKCPDCPETFVFYMQMKRHRKLHNN